MCVFVARDQHSLFKTIAVTWDSANSPPKRNCFSHEWVGESLNEFGLAGIGTMKRALTILAAAATGTLMVTAPALASDEVSASKILDSIYASLGMEDEAADVETSRNGFFVGVHSSLGADSGLSAAAAGMAIPLAIDTSADSVAANGYYVYTTNFSLGTYVGGGFGRFNLSDDPLLNPSLPQGNYGVQGMAGLTYSFTPSMVLGLEYRFSESVQNNNFSSTTMPEGERDQSVTLRFDFLLN